MNCPKCNNEATETELLAPGGSLRMYQCNHCTSELSDGVNSLSLPYTFLHDGRRAYDADALQTLELADAPDEAVPPTSPSV